MATPAHRYPRHHLVVPGPDGDWSPIGPPVEPAVEIDLTETQDLAPDKPSSAADATDTA